MPPIPPYPEERCVPRGVSVKECCPAGVGALGDVITEDEFEDGDPGVLEL